MARGANMAKNTFPQLIDRQKYLAVKIGIGIFIIHFLLAYSMVLAADPSFGSFTFNLFFLLQAPSYYLLLFKNIDFFSQKYSSQSFQVSFMDFWQAA
jgi:hypothetical protein